MYNALIALVAIIPGSDVGIAVILLTVIIRLLLLPFSLSAARTQLAMKTLEPKLKALKEKHKGNREQEALETLALYREEKINPFSSILMVLVQIPVLFALYWVFWKESFTALNTGLLYAVTPVPELVSVLFLGYISIMGKSMVLAILAGATQFWQAHAALKGTMKAPEGSTGFQADFQKVMGMQLKYAFPVLIGIISYTTSSAIALYFITTNIAGVVQEWYVHRKTHVSR